MCRRSRLHSVLVPADINNSRFCPVFHQSNQPHWLKLTKCLQITHHTISASHLCLYFYIRVCVGLRPCHLSCHHHISDNFYLWPRSKVGMRFLLVETWICKPSAPVGQRSRHIPLQALSFFLFKVIIVTAETQSFVWLMAWLLIFTSRYSSCYYAFLKWTKRVKY